MIESNNESSSKKSQSTSGGKERPDKASQISDIISIENKKRKNQEEKFRGSQKNNKKFVHRDSQISIDTSERVFNNQDLMKDTFDIDDDFLNKDGCTSVNLGLEPLYQRCYVCSICDIKREHYICNYCYLMCHEKCRMVEGKDSPKSREEYNFLGEKEFACYCGNILKHKIFKIPKILLRPCCLTQLDETLGVKIFFCEIHRKTICCVCSVECHKNCKVSKYRERENEITVCKCCSEKHSIYNEVALVFSLKDYKKLSGARVWPVQVINILFSHRDNFEKLITLFTNVLNSKEIEPEKQERFFSLLEIFTNIFDRKFKTFYFQEDIINMFKFDNLVQLIQNINVIDAASAILKSRLFFVLLFLHFKRDFQMVKCFTSIDFITNTILERIEYRKILTKPSIYTALIDKKYDLQTFFTENNVLKMIVIEDICNMIEIGMDYLNIKDHRIEFEFALKYVCFMVKKFIFTKADIKKLIKSIYIFYNRFFEFIHLDMNNNLYPLLDIFNILIELFFIFTVSYNDLTIMEYFDNNKDVTNIDDITELEDFIHYKSEHGSMLFKMVLRTCEIFKIHYELIEKEDSVKEGSDEYIEKMKEKKKTKKMIEHKIKGTDIKLPQNGGLFSEKITILFTQTLNMFCLADNIYFRQIKSITKKDLINYYTFIDRINTEKDWSYINIRQKNDITENMYKLKIGVEAELNTLFLSSYCPETLNINSHIYKKIQNFSDKLKSIILNCKKNLDLYNLQRELLIIENERELKRKKSMFLDKISKNNYSNYLFTIEEKFKDASEELVDLLIISSLDETLMKVLVMFSNRNYPNLLSYELFDIILSTMSLYFYSRRGMKYFLLGKNITRINKILNRFDYKPDNKNVCPELGKNLKSNIEIMRRALDFLIDVTDCLNYYDLTLKDHKVLRRIAKNLIIHISSFNYYAKQHNYENEFLLHFTKTLKIFYNLSNDFDQEELTRIKKQVLYVFKQNDQNIFNQDSFKTIFNSSYDEDDYFDINNENIKNKRDEKKTQFQEFLKKLDWRARGAQINIGRKKLLIDLYFSFFNLIGEKTYYTFISKENAELYDNLYNFNDLEEFRRCFQNNRFNLNQKIILLKYLRSIYMMDRLNEYDIFKQQRYLTTNEYKDLLQIGLIEEPNISNCINFSSEGELTKKKQKELKNKYFLINQIHIVIQIYLNELEQFPKQFIDRKTEDCKEFFEELVLGIKFISNFYYFQKDLWPKIFITFYQICYKFLSKIEIFKNVYTDIIKCKEPKYTVKESLYSNPLEITGGLQYKDSKEINEISSVNEIEKENQKEDAFYIMKRMSSINFDIFDSKNIYRYITEQLDNLLKYTGLNGDLGLQSYLEVYDTMAEANFTPFSLVETLDYEYFYEEEQKKDEELIAKDIQLYKLKNISDIFLETFLDIKNSNFIDTLTSYSEESLLFNYRQKFVDFFNAFLNSLEGNCSSRLEILICIITRMCFYDSQNMQEKFEDYVNDDNFFPNLNKLMNYYIVLSFSVTKNIFAYKYAERVSNITKLIIQFIQALGEGFNKAYHNNIFRFQNEIPKKENDEQLPQEIGHDGDSTSLESSLIKGSLNNDRNSENSDLKLESEEEGEKDIKSKKISKNNFKKFEEFLILKTHAPDVEITKTIYESVVVNLKRALFLLDLDNVVDCEMPYDKLIILITNFIDFLIEYIETHDDKKEIIHKNMSQLLFGSKIYNKDSTFDMIDNKSCVDIIFMKIKESKNDKLYILRKKIICYVKNKLIQLLIYYLLPGNKILFVENLINKRCSPIELYLEILYHFHDLLKHLELKNPKLIQSLNECKTNESYVDNLIKFYTYEQDFRNMIELPVILKLFILIKIYEDLYGQNVLKSNFDKMKQSKMEFDDNELGLRSKFSNRIYQFLEIVVVKVEIRQVEEKIGKIVTNVNTDKIAKRVIELIKDNTFVKQLSSRKIIQSGEKDKLSENLSETSEEESIKNNEFQEKNEGKTKITFFPRPYLTFCLNKHSKNLFELYVDRTNATSKFVELINYSDHFLFEMIVNYHLVNHSPMLQFLSCINYFYIEIVNYIFIINQNVIILIHFYNSTGLAPENYDVIEKGKKYEFFYISLIFLIIQSIFLIIFIIIWCIFKFLGSFQLNIMKSYNEFFVFRKNKQEVEEEKSEVKSQKIIDYFKEDTELGSFDMILEISKNLTLWQKLYVAIFESCIFNREVNMLICNLIFNILYASTGCYIFLSIPVLFVANIIPTLFDIFLAMKTKFSNMVIVLIFEYFVIYIFMWVTYFYLPNFFDFEDVREPHSQSMISEKYCYSSLQCYMMILNAGIRAGGGIGDVIDMVSYRSDVRLFIGRFFYDMLFFILIVLVLGNLFLGIIVDSFEELRIINIETERDVKNICFICQLSRDACLTRNIDFEKHVSKEHNKWNYVYFLTYLQINNPNDFSGIENSVWEKLDDQDFGWIPIEESND